MHLGEDQNKTITLQDPNLPDLSLNIRPPTSATTPQLARDSGFDMWRCPGEEEGGAVRASLSASPSMSRSDTELSLAATSSDGESPCWRRSNLPAAAAQEFRINRGFSMLGVSEKPLFLTKPIKGIPLYSNPSSSTSSASSLGSFYRPYSNPNNSSNGLAMEMSLNRSSHHHHQQNRYSQFQFLSHNYNNMGGNSNSDLMMRSSRLQPKRNMRAPRMRWTSSLHARFIHAVQLLGGHERATPKSVLELMDVKDLTLAHVKSHLQMYRTVKNTDKPVASSEGSGDDEMLPQNNYDEDEEQRGAAALCLHHSLPITTSRALQGSSRDIAESLSSNHHELDLEVFGNKSNPRQHVNVITPSLDFSLGRPDCDWPTGN